jgi:hypothetical protein
MKTRNRSRERERAYGFLGLSERVRAKVEPMHAQSVVPQRPSKHLSNALASLACTLDTGMRFHSTSRCGGYGLLRRCHFNLDLVRPVHHYFGGVPREPRFGLFTEQTCFILSANIMLSEMLARRYARGTAGSAVSVAQKKLARTLILIIGTLGLNFAGQGCHSHSGTWWIQPWPPYLGS